MGTGREATGWPIQGARNSLGWSGQGGRWARVCQARAGGRASEWLGHLLPCCWQCPRAPLLPPTPSPCRPGIPPGRRLQSKRPPVKPQGRLHTPSVPGCHLCRSLAWTTDSCPVLRIRSLVSFPARLSISQGSAGLGGFLRRRPCPSVPARLHRGFTACLRGGPGVCLRWGLGGLYLVILVGGHRDEGSLWEHMGAEGCVFGAKSIVLVGLHDVQPWLVLVHGVEDDLEEKGLLSAPGPHPCLQPCPAGPGLAFLLLNSQGSRV